MQPNTLVRLGFVAMSMELKNASPSQTMTFTQFEKIPDREAAIRKLERISLKNIDNTRRILAHCASSDIHFYRFSSRLIPLANHEDLNDWNYMEPLKNALKNLGDFIRTKGIRVDFHPDHFVLMNSTDQKVLKNSVRTLWMHYFLLKGMGIDPTHRCVLHVGGQYHDPEKSLEQFVDNWMDIPERLQRMIMLENDDTSFTLEDTLYLCEKLGIPLVFDYHHHLAYHKSPEWEIHWERIVKTWNHSPLPIKMHISSPKDGKNFRHHADYINVEMFFDFLQKINGSVPQIDCMIEAKKKDVALFRLMEEIKWRNDIELVDGSSFILL